VFARDEVRLAADRLHVTVGAKVERDSEAGWSVQPSVEATWIVVPKRQFLWAYSARALRTPSVSDRGVRVDLPPLLGVAPLPIRVSAVGTPNRPSEVLTDVEAGYRLAVTAVATVAVTGFYGRYGNLATSEPGEPVLTFGDDGPYLAVESRFGSLLAASTRGIEVDAHWTPVPRWRLDASYTAFRLTPRLDPASLDVAARTFDGDASRAQWQVHSGVTLGQRTEIDTTLFRVGALAGLKVPAYTRVDARLAVPLGSRLTASFVGQNLFDALHVEFGASQATTRQTLVRRSARFLLTWRY
jgi:outer membrane receptor protein involved in Fe transport